MIKNRAKLKRDEFKIALRDLLLTEVKFAEQMKNAKKTLRKNLKVS